MSLRRPARTVTPPADHVVVVGAGLGGLACAMHLAAAGRRVTLLERGADPGGRAGRLSVDGYAFDTGPTVLTMPSLLEEPFAALGERMSDWITLIELDPAYRARFADGSSVDVIADPERMAEEISRVCGTREADGYRRFVGYARRLWELERSDFIDRNFDSPTDLLTMNLLRLARMGAFGRLQGRIDRYFADPRTRKIFSFQAMYAGLAPHKALALYAVIAYLDCVGGVFHPVGGVHALPAAMAGAAQKHGVDVRYDTEVTSIETRSGRAVAVHTLAGEQIPADAVVLNPDLPAAKSLIPGPRYARKLRFSPSCVVLHIGSDRAYPSMGHHTIHFGDAWKKTFAEVIDRGELMSDPSLLVTNPTRTDPSVAPAGHHTYYVLAPAPNLVTGRLDWDGDLAERYADQLIDTLEARGYPGFAAGVRHRTVITPATWARDGLAGGTPFAAAHTFRQTGPFRPGNLHPGLSNVVFTGSGTVPGVGVPMVLISGRISASRITGVI